MCLRALLLFQIFHDLFVVQLLNIEGLGRQLYPDLDLWSTAQPYLERWMRERMLPQNQLRYWQQQLEQVPTLLTSTQRAMERIADTPPTNAPKESPRSLRVAGLALVVLGAVGLGLDAPAWGQAQALHAVVTALGGWLILRR